MIVGVQKAGTTALAHFLAQHPAIGMATPKEVHCSTHPPTRPVGPGRDRRPLPAFFDVTAEAAIRGEATPIYLFLPAIARELKRYNRT